MADSRRHEPDEDFVAAWGFEGETLDAKGCIG
jgi:hypothetical protein